MKTQHIMSWVLAGLFPGIVAMVFIWGPGVLWNILGEDSGSHIYMLPQFFTQHGRHERSRAGFSIEFNIVTRQRMGTYQ